MMQGTLLRMNLRDARSRIGLTQKQLAERAHISHVTVNACEQGQNILRIKAYAILDALNAEYTMRNLETLTITDLDWSIKG